jgi:hypothetical protein
VNLYSISRKNRAGEPGCGQRACAEDSGLFRSLEEAQQGLAQGRARSRSLRGN